MIPRCSLNASRRHLCSSNLGLPCVHVLHVFTAPAWRTATIDLAVSALHLQFAGCAFRCHAYAGHEQASSSMSPGPFRHLLMYKHWRYLLPPTHHVQILDTYNTTTQPFALLCIYTWVLGQCSFQKAVRPPSTFSAQPTLPQLAFPTCCATVTCFVLVNLACKAQTQL